MNKTKRALNFRTGIICLALLTVCFAARFVKASGEISLYVVYTSTNGYILPDSSISTITVMGSATNQITMRACAGEFEPASFVVRANTALTDLALTISNLTGAAGTISSDNVNVRVVKCWWSRGRYRLKIIYAIIYLNCMTSVI